MAIKSPGYAPGGGGGGGISALTGDVTASGTGSVAATVTNTSNVTSGKNAFTLQSATSGAVTPASGALAIQRLSYALSGALTVAVPSGTPGDNDTIIFAFYNPTGAAINITLASGYAVPSASSLAFPYSVAAGKEWYAAARYSSRRSAWQIVNFEGGY